MEKEQLFMKFMEIARFAKPDKKGGKHHHGEHPKRGEKPEDGENKHKDPLRMPPSAKSVLTTLLREKKLNQRTLAKNTNITAQGISDMLKKLEKDQLIQKETGSAYNENIIMLTPKGEHLAGEIEAKTKEHAEKMFKDFTCEELQTLEKLLEKIYENSNGEECIK